MQQLVADGLMEQQSLNGHNKMNIFITGGSKGIGRAIVEKLSSVDNNIVFTCNLSVEEATDLIKNNSNCSFYLCDLRDYDRCKSVAHEVLLKYGRIDILINNAGYDNDALFTKMNKETWDDVLNVNLNSIFNFTNLFLPQMIENGWGRILNVTSIAGFTGAFGKSNYSAAKAGIVGFTKSLALELGAKGITVNAVAPGAIETDMLNRIPQKYKSKILEAIPVKRFGTPDEVADLVAFLISEQASYITGQTIHINGGSYL